LIFHKYLKFDQFAGGISLVLAGESYIETTKIAVILFECL